MNKDTSKKIIIILSIVVVLIIIAIVAILFLATDIFKSSEQLFYKYIAQNSKFTEMFESDSFSLLEEKKSIAPYMAQGEISIKQLAEEGTDGVDNELFKIATEGKSDIPSQKQYYNINLVQSENNLLNIKYLRTGDKYALTSDEIVTKYVAVENNNLKELFSKLGISNEQLESIPDRIETTNILNQIEFTQNEKSQIVDKYSNVLTTLIQKEKFSKNNKTDIVLDGKTYKAKIYTLTLTNIEIKNIAINILNTLQNDDATLSIVLNKYNKLANNSMTLENLKQQISDIINRINNIQLDRTENVNINLYVSNGELLKTEVVTVEATINIVYSVVEDKVTVTIKPSNIELYNGSFDNLEIRKIETDSEYSLNILLNNVNNTQNTDSISLQISNAGNINSNNIRQLNILQISQDDESYEIRYSNNITFEVSLDIDELNDDNSVTLNNYTEQELIELIEALQNRITQVIQEKMMYSNEANTEPNIYQNTQINEETENQEGQGEISELERQEIDMFNEQFTPYLGESVQGEKVKTLLQNLKTAVQNGNEIDIHFSGIYNNTSVERNFTSVTQEQVDEILQYIILSKNYFVEGLADIRGRLVQLTIKENT